MRNLLVAAIAGALVACGGSGDDPAASRPSPEDVVRIDAVEYPNGIAAADGALWVADPEAGTVTVLDPATGKTERTLDVGVGAFLIGGIGDDLWVSVHQAGDIVRLDVPTGRTVEHADVGKFPEAVQVVAGHVWIQGDAARTIYRVDPDTPPEPVVSVRGEIEGFAVTPDGDIWLTTYGTGSAFRFRPNGRAAGSLETGPGAAGVAWGAGRIWVANADAGTVTAVDARSGRVTDEVDTGGSPRGLAFLHDRLWVTDGGSGTVYEVDPATLGVTPHEVPAPVVAFAPVPGAVWATSADAAAVVRLDI
jgi:YVTN family beta-propeller protein